MQEGVLFAVVGALVALSTLVLAYRQLRPVPSAAMPLAGSTPRGNAWLLDPDRGDAGVTRWKLTISAPSPGGRIVAAPAGVPDTAWLQPAGRLGQRRVETPANPVAGIPGWSAWSEAPVDAARLAALARWPADLPPPVVLWDRDLQIFASLPPDDTRTGDLVQFGAALADGAQS